MSDKELWAELEQEALEEREVSGVEDFEKESSGDYNENEDD